jgi:Spy/CpxP family protein refolding chaperone
MKLKSIFITISLLLAAAILVRSQDEETRKNVLHQLGGPFFVSREKVQEDLKLSDDQKQKLREKLSGDVQNAGETLEKLKGMKGGEREKALQPSYEKLEAFLKENLTADQLKRFGQLKLQYDTPSVMLRPEIGKQLDITDEQRSQFMGLIQNMQKEIGPLIKEAKSGGNAQEILAKVTKMRLDCQGKIETLLSDAQKKQWQDMTGKPLIIW